jgi:elongation factor Ts
MAEITAATVKALRERTGQGMMECKKALVQTDGDMDAAVELLRKKGLAAAEKKAGREAKEGLVAVHRTDGGAVMVEVVCETDFCARNEEFQKMVEAVASLAAAAPDGPVEGTEEIDQAVQACFNKIGENMRYGRGVKISAPTVGHYLHHNRKVGVVVGVEGEIPPETLNELCMHIAFADPMALTVDEIPAEVVEREKRIAAEQAAEAGKPPQVIEKIVQGKVRKFLATQALLEQSFVKDEKKKVKDVLGDAKVKTFARFAIGP